MSDYTEYYEYYKKAWEKSLSKGTQKGGAMVRIKMGGYVDQNDKIMTKEELDNWIIEIQFEIERLQKQVSDITAMWTSICADNLKLSNVLGDIIIGCEKCENIAREALKGGE